MKQKVLILIFLAFSFMGYSQCDKDTLYFLIDKEDSLIQKLNNRKTGKHSGYLVLSKFYEPPVKVNESLDSSKVWVPTAEDDVIEIPGHSFSFMDAKGKIMGENDLKKLNIITDRNVFLECNDKFESAPTFFIIPSKNDGYIMRKMFPIYYE